MLRKLVQYVFMGLVLLLVFLSSALLAMRFAIQGREVKVPKLEGLTPVEAERSSNSQGLVLSIEGRVYSPTVAAGRIASQSPPQQSMVRRGWKVRALESLGPQRSAVPNLVGQSEHAAAINVGRRGLEMGTIARLYLPNSQPETVVAQSPAADAQDVSSPKINLIVASNENQPRYVMPSFVGKDLDFAKAAMEKAGLKPPQVYGVPADSKGHFLIARQWPSAGVRISTASKTAFEVKR